MNAKKKTLLYRLLSGALVLLGFSACSDEEEELICMYGTIAKHYIRSLVTDADEKPIEGIRTVLEYKGINGELVRDTTYTNAKGRTEQDLSGGMDDLETAKAKLTFEDVDGAKNGSFKSHTVEVSIKDTYFGREEIRVKLEERESDE